MPILTPTLTDYSSLLQTSTLASEIVNRAGQEVRNVLDPGSTADQTIFLDYLNRVQLRLLRASRWTFLLSDVQFFITQREQSDYFIGPVGQALPGQVDTLLDLNDVDFILRNSVFDVTNARMLQKMDNKPYSQGLSFRDAQFRPGRPATWRNDLLQPSLIQVYPAPDNQNSYQPVPQSPYVSVIAAGSLLKRKYYTVATFVDSNGNEGTASTVSTITNVPAGNVAIVHSPVLPENVTSSVASYTQYNVYISTIDGASTKQNASPIDLETDWTEPTTGLIAGTRPPTVSALEVMDGYIIGFRYMQQRQVVQTLGTIIQIPDVYKDIVIAGVTMYACQYLRMFQDAQVWQQQYQAGIQDMIRDRNAGPREDDFIRPDDSGVGIGSNLSYIDTFDLNR